MRSGRSGLFVVTDVDPKKGTATGWMNGESCTVNIEPIAKDLKARLGWDVAEDE